jgi:hypothetical protein
MMRPGKQPKAASKKRKSAPRQASTTTDNAQTVRFSATITPRRKAGPNWIEKLNIDRLPDPKGVVRALVTAADCVRLVNQGLDVHLHQAYPVQPLDPKLIETDESFRRWLEKRLPNLKRAQKRKGPKKG